MYCLDANVWVYYLDAGLDEHEAVAPHVEGVIEREPIFLPAVVAMEVVHYVSNQLAESERVVRTLLDLDGVTTASLTSEDVRRAATLLREYSNTGLGGRDASILATIERYDVTALWTHDRALATVAKTVEGLDVVDPVVDT
jgi:uncharacterized protein